MASYPSLTELSESDYEAIEAAVMETARGRWFLSEFARRNRTADTEMLISALGRLETAVSGERVTQQIDRVRVDLLEMAKMIAHLQIDIASENPALNQIGQATETLDSVVNTTESATTAILAAAEQIQEIAWTLREAGTAPASCDLLDQRAADIYTACGFQDLTAQRTRKVVNTLRAVEGRINGLIDAWATSDEAPAPTIEARMAASFPAFDAARPASSASAMLEGEALAHQNAAGSIPEGPATEIQRRRLYSPVPMHPTQLSQDDVDVVIIGDEMHEIDPAEWVPEPNEMTLVQETAQEEEDGDVVFADERIDRTAASLALQPAPEQAPLAVAAALPLEEETVTLPPLTVEFDAGLADPDWAETEWKDESWRAPETLATPADGLSDFSWEEVPFSEPPKAAEAMGAPAPPSAQEDWQDVAWQEEPAQESVAQQSLAQPSLLSEPAAEEWPSDSAADAAPVLRLSEVDALDARAKLEMFA